MRWEKDIFFLGRYVTEWHSLTRRDVHAFVKCAVLHAAFADAGQADKIFLAAKTFRQQCAHRHRHHRAEVANHGELTVAWLSVMNIAVRAAHRPLPGAKISAGNVDNRFAERRTARLIANQWRKDVALLQKHSTSNADRFLAFADVNAAGDLAAAVKTDQFLLERACEQHPAKRLQESLMRRRLLG